MSKRIIMNKKSKILDALGKLNIKQMDEDVYLLIGKNNGTFPYSNSLLILDEKVVLVDSGLGDELLHIIKGEVDVLINSHYHIDHILGNHLFNELWVVEEEAGITGSFENYKRFAGILGTSVEGDWLRWFHQHFKFHTSFYTRIFKHNEVFRFGETEWKTIHTPGHSPGHCCFYEPNKKLMFSSDIDLTPFGPWYGNPNANLTDFIQSIKKLSDFNIDVIATSHTKPIENNINKALEDYLNIIFEREERILEILEKEKTLEQLETYNIMYKKEQKRYKAFAWFEKNMIKKHLDRLIELGKVERTGKRYRTL
jgi:glyoxylase-like metal-dependent hydrolase (beta-lactamase superfamily II)